jgi:hypothetical protein
MFFISHEKNKKHVHFAWNDFLLLFIWQSYLYSIRLITVLSCYVLHEAFPNKPRENLLFTLLPKQVLRMHLGLFLFLSCQGRNNSRAGTCHLPGPMATTESGTGALLSSCCWAMNSNCSWRGSGVLYPTWLLMALEFFQWEPYSRLGIRGNSLLFTWCSLGIINRSSLEFILLNLGILLGNA